MVTPYVGFGFLPVTRAGMDSVHVGGACLWAPVLECGSVSCSAPTCPLYGDVCGLGFQLLEHCAVCLRVCLPRCHDVSGQPGASVPRPFALEEGLYVMSLQALVFSLWTEVSTNWAPPSEAFLYVFWF